MSAAADPADTFRQEAQELLEQLEGALLDLEESPDDRDLIDTAFRALHTIKGSGAMFGFDAVAAFTHHVENAFDLVRKGKVTPSRALIGIALSAKDHMRALIENAATADRAVGEAVLGRLQALLDGAGDKRATAPANAAANANANSGAEPRGDDGPASWRIRFVLARDSLALGTNPLLLLDELRELGPCTVTALTDMVPPLEEMEADGCYLGWDVLLTTARPRADIEAVFIFVIDDAELKIERLRVEAGEKRLGEILIERGAVTADAIDQALGRQQPLGTLLVNAGIISEAALVPALAEQKHLRKEAEEAKGAVKATASLRVPAERLDDLMDQVGELVIAQARLKQLAAAGSDIQMKAIAEEVERLSSGLRDTTMGIRMVPIGSLFGRFRRLVRDLAGDLGKQIQLTTSGEETELDKTVIERLNDPLVHLIRNSIDHGIEEPDVRAHAGKATEGRVHLAASHSGAQVVIAIRDDGKGLDRARIRARAEEQGLVAAGAKLTDTELLQLVFHPGLSTAQRVTSVSGRGVGMDVVKRAIDALRGTIEITSQPGQGSEVVLRLPLTLAIIDGLLVRVGRGRYVIPLAAVEECVELSPEQDQRSAGRSFLNIRGDLVPFLRLREQFNVTLPAEPYPKVVIVANGDQRVGLVVDQVIGDHQTVIKSLSPLHADVETFSGATILGDGTVALILDVTHLIAAGTADEPLREAS